MDSITFALAVAAVPPATEKDLLAKGRAEAAAWLAQVTAARQLSEREPEFGAALKTRAGEQVSGKGNATPIAAAVGNTSKAGELIARERAPCGRRFTTREAVALEKKMLAIESGGRSSVAAPQDRQEATCMVTTAAFFAEANGWCLDEPSSQFFAANSICEWINMIQFYFTRSRASTELSATQTKQLTKSWHISSEAI
ncbi:hypothetical protein [Erythrobacter donghaensis]|uniref:hypothetical protein n=1 Tax=Erythrobacter donghaensis TaxID=267135 RepID=UPI0012D9E118|nr:hypothetical protein [Erythrobacter donghaensis]